MKNQRALDDEAQLQNVLHEIMISNPKKKGQNRALTVGSGKACASLSQYNNGIGGLVHIPRFQKEIILNELMRGEKSCSSDPF
jgi:hypothetical protein